MKLLEKIYSIFAILFAIALIVVLLRCPDTRELNILLPLATAGFLINIGLLFIVLRDIFMRKFESSTTKYIWIAFVLFFWPSIIFYLPKHGFKKRA